MEPGVVVEYVFYSYSQVFWKWIKELVWLEAFRTFLSLVNQKSGFKSKHLYNFLKFLLIQQFETCRYHLLNIEHRNGFKMKILHLQSIFLLTGKYGQNEIGNQIVMDFVNPIVHPTQNALFLVRSFRRFAFAMINLTTTSDIVCKVISEIVTQLFTWKTQRVKNLPNT